MEPVSEGDPALAPLSQLLLHHKHSAQEWQFVTQKVTHMLMIIKTLV
jgi:hypothetical protein